MHPNSPRFVVRTLLPGLALLLSLMPACRPAQEEAEAPPPITDPLAYLPADCSWMMQADLGPLRERADLEALFRHETLEALLGSGETGAWYESAELLFNNGFDTQRPLLLYQIGASPVRLAAGLGTEDSLRAGLLRMGMPEPANSGALRYCSGGGMTVAWNDHIVLTVSRELQAGELPDSLFAVPDSALSARADLPVFLAREGDLHVYGDPARLNFSLPWFSGLMKGDAQARLGLRLVNQTGTASLHMEWMGLSEESALRMDRWFEAAASTSRSWERLPAGTPAWMNVALPSDPADLAWMEEGLFAALSASGTEATLAFHQIKLPQFYPRVSLLMPRRKGVELRALESGLRKQGLSRTPGQLQIMGLRGRYTANPNWVVASSTDDPATLLKPPAAALSLPESYREALLSSPVRLYAQSEPLSQVLPLPTVVRELKDLVLYATRSDSGEVALNLIIRTSNPEAYGLPTAARVILDIIPAVQMLSSLN
jgi:hypothetical protein